MGLLYLSLFSPPFRLGVCVFPFLFPTHPGRGLPFPVRLLYLIPNVYRNKKLNEIPSKS